MPKKEETKKEETPKVESKSDRQKRWEAYVENYKKANPVKGVAKEARGEFKVIPPSFI